MTLMHIDLIKYSTPAALTSHERQAVHSRRQARRARFLSIIEQVFSSSPRFPMVATRRHVK